MSIFTTIDRQIKTLSPVYFALAMATGIISIACHLLGLPWLANFLFALNNVAYCLLLVLFVLRLLRYPQEIMNQLSNGPEGAGFLTFVAGSGTLGLQYCLIANNFLPAVILWLVAFMAWLFFLYGFLLIRITGLNKPDPEKGLNGGWLLIVVSTQSLAILGSQLAAHLPLPVGITLFYTACLYLLGLFLYIVLLVIIFLRMTFDPMKPQEFTPPYWVLMGAVAITALSGAVFIQAIAHSASYSDWIPVIKVLSLLAWAVATWWIPLLVMLEIWRHFIKKMPLRYQPANWDTVFTLGMYTVCSLQLARALQISWLAIVPRVFIYFALTAWLVTFLAMLASWRKKRLSDSL